MSHPRVILSRDLGEFFRDEVCEARSHLGIELSQLTEYYLVKLLCDFSRVGSQPRPGDEPLALIYKRALEADQAARLRMLKDLGDVALYVAGFFVEFIERSLVDLDYYISMGGNAYTGVSALVGAQPHGEQFAELYAQLAQRFTEMVDLLHQIAERTRDCSTGDQGLLRLYDRWLRTRSQRMRKLLIEAGLFPSEDLSTEYIQ